MSDYKGDFVVGDIAGSSPNRWFGLKQRKKITQACTFEGGFSSFYEKPRVVTKISECRKKNLQGPETKEYCFRSGLRMFPGRQSSNDRPQGIRRVDRVVRKEKRMFSRKKRIVRKDEGIFNHMKSPTEPKSKNIKGKKQVEAPKTVVMDIEKEIQSKRRVKPPKREEPKSISKINLHVSDPKLQFRVEETETVSAFNPKMTMLDKKLLKASKRRHSDKDNSRYRADLEREIKNLPWKK